MKKNELAEVQLPNGLTAIMFTENPSKQLGIVDVATVKRLAQLLQFANLSEIRDEFIGNLKTAQNMKEYVDMIAMEFNFQTTINLLAAYTPNPVKEEVETYVKAEKKPWE